MPRQHARPFETSSESETSESIRPDTKKPAPIVEKSTPNSDHEQEEGWRKLPGISESLTDPLKSESNSLLKISLEPDPKMSSTTFLEIFKLAQLIVSAGQPKLLIDQSTQTEALPDTTQEPVKCLSETSETQELIRELDEYLKK